MAVVTLAALNFGAIRAVLGRGDRFNEAWLMRALPMANALVVSLLIGYWRRGCHRFHLGFQSFGTTALSLCIAGDWLYPDMTGLHFRFFTEPHGLSLTTIQIATWDTIPLVTIVLSQFIFALVGGFLFHGFRIR